MPQAVHGRRLRTRRILLFLVAIGLPCVVLVALSLRMLAQERELADKRLGDERRRIVAGVRQELLSRLERLRLQALNADRTGVSLAADARRAVAAVARIEGDRLVLPWDRGLGGDQSALQEDPFAESIRAGEQRELVLQQFNAAADAYRRAESKARVPSQQAFAQLLVARALDKAGRGAEASRLYRTLVAMPATVVDEQGVPFAFYAARRLMDSRNADREDRERLIRAFRAALDASDTLTPVAVYMLDDLVADLKTNIAPTEDAAALASGVAALKVELDQAVALQRALPSLLPRSSLTAAATTWMPFGEDRLWLVNVSAEGPVMLVAVRAAEVLPALEAGRSATDSADGSRVQRITLNGEGELLGASFPGLSVVFEPGEPAMLAAVSLQRSFYVAAVALVMSMTLLGAYLFWRDVQREVQLADMRSQFVSSVSHELKTPLTAIRMFAETLLMGRSDRPDTREEYLETIVNESERLTRLLNNVLDFSKIEQGRKTYRLELQSLSDIADSAARAMQYPLLEQGFDLKVAVDDALPLIAADADAIQQAILNLLSNAMKFSADSRVIELRVTQADGWAIIAVTDRGFGIPPGEHERIFQKFYRIASPEYDRIPGTGLGLTLVDHVVRAHGGRVRVRSAPGEGSTFSIVLPLALSPSGPAAREALA